MDLDLDLYLLGAISSDVLGLRAHVERIGDIGWTRAEWDINRIPAFPENVDSSLVVDGHVRFLLVIWSSQRCDMPHAICTLACLVNVLGLREISLNQAKDVWEGIPLAHVEWPKEVEKYTCMYVV